MTWLFFQMFFRQYLRNVNISANTELSQIVSLSHFKIISSPLIWPLFLRKGFIMFQKFLFETTRSLEIFLKYFLILFLRDTFIPLYFVLLLIFFLGAFKKIFLNLLRVYIAFLSSLFIKGAWFPLKNLFFKGAWRSTILLKVSVIKR